MNKQSSACYIRGEQRKRVNKCVHSELCDYLHPSIQHTVLVGSGYCFRCGTSMYNNIFNIFSLSDLVQYLLSCSTSACWRTCPKASIWQQQQQKTNNELGKPRAQAVFFWWGRCRLLIHFDFSNKNKNDRRTRNWFHCQSRERGSGLCVRVSALRNFVRFFSHHIGTGINSLLVRWLVVSDDNWWANQFCVFFSSSLGRRHASSTSFQANDKLTSLAFYFNFNFRLFCTFARGVSHRLHLTISCTAFVTHTLTQHEEAAETPAHAQKNRLTRDSWCDSVIS